jgi:hypothetical protein
VTKCASLLTAVLEDAKLKAALVGLLTDLCRDPQVVQTVTEMALTIIARNDIYNVIPADEIGLIAFKSIRLIVFVLTGHNGSADQIIHRAAG